MNHKQTPASPKTRNTLYESMGKTIQCFSQSLKECIILLESFPKHTIKSEIFDAFLSLNIYIQYVSVELSSIVRACFRANLPTEKLYNLKWINCVIFESYMYLYGYGKDKNQSLWITKVKPLLDFLNHQEFEDDYKIVENQIIKFRDSNITSRNNRNLSFHYDLEPLSVYNMWINLNEEEEFQRMNRFMALLHDINLFTSKYIRDNSIKINFELKPSDYYYTFSFSDFDIFGDNKDTLFSKMESAIQDHAIRLGSFISFQNIPELISKHFPDMDDESVASIHRIIEINKISIQLTYIAIDLASAVRAFISSEYTMERQLSLKQINTIIYEGFNKLYALDDNLEKSFWGKFICPLITVCKDSTMISEFNSIDKKLRELQQIVIKYDRQRQLSVHLDAGIPAVYSMLHSLNPVKEVIKASQLLNILPKILDFLSKCLNMIYLNNQAIYKKRKAPVFEKIDDIINNVKLSPNLQQKDKEEFIELLLLYREIPPQKQQSSTIINNHQQSTAPSTVAMLNQILHPFFSSLSI